MCMSEQNYLPTALEGKPANPNTTTTDKEAPPSIVDSVKDNAVNLYATAVATADLRVSRLNGTAQTVTEFTHNFISKVQRLLLNLQQNPPSLTSRVRKALLSLQPKLPSLASNSPRPLIWRAASSRRRQLLRLRSRRLRRRRRQVQSAAGVCTNAVERHALAEQKIKE